MKTVYVIGAGASAEVDLPTGEKLKQSISESLNLRFDHSRLISGDYEINNAIREFAKDQAAPFGEYIKACRHISEALLLTPSIDNFIDSHRDDDKISFCSKIAIAKTIIEAEASSKLFFDRYKEDKIDFDNLVGTWYLPFFQILMENCDLEEFETRLKDLFFIVFNYDRCLEQFLFFAIQNLYRVPPFKAKEIVEKINIFTHLTVRI